MKARFRTGVVAVVLVSSLVACSPGEMERAAQMIEEGATLMRQSFDAGYQAGGLEGGLEGAMIAAQWVGMAAGATFGGP